jgi:hypothetical protein
LSPVRPAPSAIDTIDHVVLAVPDLAAASTRFAALSGIVPLPGGRHLGLGTANRLVGLGAGRYLEIVGPDPASPNPQRPRPFGIDGLTQPHLVTWARATGEIDNAVARARHAGYDPGAPRAMSRRTPDGALLSWRLTLAADGMDTGVVPFLIEWGNTPHPSAQAGLPTLDVESFDVVAADLERVRSATMALGLDVPVAAGIRDSLLLRLATPRGPMVIA